MFQLTQQQHDQIASTTTPLEVIDPADGKSYVLVAKELFQQNCFILDDGDDIESWYPLMDQAAKNVGWDSEPDLYGDLDTRRDA